MILPLLIALAPLATSATLADPCAPAPLGLVADLDSIPALHLEAFFLPSAPPPTFPGLDLSLRMEFPSIDYVETWIDLAFMGSRELARTNLVHDNSTGKVVKDKKGRTSRETMKGVTEIRRIGDLGAIQIESGLQIDADGSADSTTVDPDHGQVDTSLKWLDAEGKAHAIDTFKVPFFVLPMGWYKEQGIELGDIAAVIYKDRIEYAIFADVGPYQKLGEASIALHDNLGNKPWTASGKPWNGIETEPGVTLVVFPDSREEAFPLPTGETLQASRVHGEPDLARIREVGQARLESLLDAQVGVSPKTTPTTRPGTEAVKTVKKKK